MAKMLSFADTSPQQVKIGDTTTVFTLICSDDNAPIDLTNATSIIVKLGNDLNYLKSQPIDVTSLSDPATGEIVLSLTADFMGELVAGGYRLEIWVTDEEGTGIYPSEGTLGFSINSSLS